MKANKGFTLIELLVVVLIIGILAAIALPQYSTAVEKARSAEALALMSSIAGSAERYRLQKDNWPGATDFNKLDIEVPKIDSTTYGGKNFEITMGAPNGVAGTTFVIAATRRLTSGGKYVLKTKLVDNNTDGTITATRSCGISFDTSTDNTQPGEDSEAYKFCAAVTSGNLTDF